MRVVLLPVLAVVFLGYFAPRPVSADVRILGSPGGEVAPFLQLYEAVRRSGERVVIDGPCLSACTLVLSMVPRNRICVTRRAAFGFHAARWLDQSGRFHSAPRESQLVLATYPSAVRRWIERRGGLSARLLVLRGNELRTMFPACR